VRIDLVGTTADFRRFGPQRSLPFNDLPSENPGTAGRIGEVGLAMERGLLLFYRQLGMRERLGVRVRQLKGLAAERVHGKAGRRFKPVPHAKLSSDLLHIDRLSLVGAIVGAMTNSQRMREAR